MGKDEDDGGVSSKVFSILHILSFSALASKYYLFNMYFNIYINKWLTNANERYSFFSVSRLSEIAIKIFRCETACLKVSFVIVDD